MNDRYCTLTISSDMASVVCPWRWNRPPNEREIEMEAHLISMLESGRLHHIDEVLLFRASLVAGAFSISNSKISKSRCGGTLQV